MCNEMKADNSKLETVMREREVYYRSGVELDGNHQRVSSHALTLGTITVTV